VPQQPRSRSSKRPSQKLRKTGQRLLRFDRRLGARFVAGADEAGRGCLAGPLVVAGVLLDYGKLRDHRVRPLALLNDSKQVDPAGREELYAAVVGCAERVAVRVIPHGDIDRHGLHRSNLAGLRAVLEALAPPAEARSPGRSSSRASSTNTTPFAITVFGRLRS
jgi:ribonuclease HII